MGDIIDKFSDISDEKEQAREKYREKIQLFLDKYPVSVKSVHYRNRRIIVKLYSDEIEEELENSQIFEGLKASTEKELQIEFKKPYRPDGGGHIITNKAGKFLIRRIFSSSDSESSRRNKTKKERAIAKAEVDFLYYFHRDSIIYGFFGIVFPVIILLIDIIACGSVPNFIFGLCMELTGAWALAQAVFVSPQEIYDISTSGFGGPSLEFRRALAKEAADGFWGISLLIAGITAQSLAQIGISVPMIGCRILLQF